MPRDIAVEQAAIRFQLLLLAHGAELDDQRSPELFGYEERNVFEAMARKLDG